MKYQSYPNYKDSGIGWLGQIPEDWQKYRFCLLFRRNKETNHPDAELLSIYRDFGVILKSDRDDNYNRPSEDLSTYQFVRKDDLVVNKMKAWQGSLAISEYEGIISPAYYVANPISKFNRKFLHHLLRSTSYADYFYSLSKGIRPNQWDLDYQDLNNTPIFLPSSDEQNRIVDFLDTTLANFDSVTSILKRSIEALKEKRQAIITHAVTKGLDPNVPMKDSGIEWIGKIPQSWKICTAKEVFKKITDGSHFSPQEEINGPSFIATVADIKDDKISIDSCKRISYEDYNMLVAGGCKPEKGDILFTKDGTIGLCFPFAQDIDIVLLSSIAILKPGNELLPMYGSYFLKSRAGIEQALGLQTGSALKRITLKNLSPIRISLPDIEEQGRIVEYLDVETYKLSSIIYNQEKMIKLLIEYKAALITHAVTGKIDVRGLILEAKDIAGQTP